MHSIEVLSLGDLCQSTNSRLVLVPETNVAIAKSMCSRRTTKRKRKQNCHRNRKQYQLPSIKYPHRMSLFWFHSNAFNVFLFSHWTARTNKIEIVKMAKATAVTTTDQLEMDQMAELELDRLHKQVKHEYLGKSTAENKIQKSFVALRISDTQNGKRSHRIFGWKEEWNDETWTTARCVETWTTTNARATDGVASWAARTQRVQSEYTYPSFIIFHLVHPPS